MKVKSFINKEILIRLLFKLIKNYSNVSPISINFKNIIGIVLFSFNNIKYNTKNLFQIMRVNFS